MSAALDFAKLHAKVKNEASGTMHEEKTVTVAEMIEHFFYQMVNMSQIVYLHHLHVGTKDFGRNAALLVFTTSIWLFRGRFPIHSFMQNYASSAAAGLSVHSFEIERFLYRVKKWQYVLYKTALLHGLNVSAVFFTENLARRKAFQLYWRCLNASYVMEFFLQTLVKRRTISQVEMLTMNMFLMVVSTAAIPILRWIDPVAFSTCFMLNFLNRKRELMNVLVSLSAMYMLRIKMG